MHEQELRKHRCCFTGHRPEKLNISEEQLCVRLVSRQFHETFVADFAVHIVLIQPLNQIIRLISEIRSRASYLVAAAVFRLPPISFCWTSTPKHHALKNAMPKIVHKMFSSTLSG